MTTSDFVCTRVGVTPASPVDELHQRNCSASSPASASGGTVVRATDGRSSTSSAAAGLAHHPPTSTVAAFPYSTSCRGLCGVKPVFHDTDTDILADILAMIVARMSACQATSPFSLPQE